MHPPPHRIISICCFSYDIEETTKEIDRIQHFQFKRDDIFVIKMYKGYHWKPEVQLCNINGHLFLKLCLKCLSCLLESHP